VTIRRTPDAGNGQVTQGAARGRPQPVTTDRDDRSMNQFPTSFSFTTSAVPTTLSGRADPETARSPASTERLFGRLLMSIREVRNSLRAMASRVNERHAEAEEMLDEAAFVEDALRDWAQKSPNDPALPYLIFNLANLYSTMDTDDAHLRKDAVLEWLTSSFLPRAYDPRAARAKRNAR